ncbi:hypothetical protein [Microtetraspora malaysiensis]|uniref:hypothetical protein n=1 Tax=Microtetraspora malaysiensis TaxID=161358 RepID=UPI003D937D4A
MAGKTYAKNTFGRAEAIKDLGELINAGRWEDARKLVDELPALGRAQRWKDAVAWIVEKHDGVTNAEDPDAERRWAILQGSVFLVHANL